MFHLDLFNVHYVLMSVSMVYVCVSMGGSLVDCEDEVCVERGEVTAQCWI